VNGSHRFQSSCNSTNDSYNKPNIISVSRRTDIPAFFSAWFQKRLEEGYVVVKNPYNATQIKKISLHPNDVICFVFWSKNPKPMITLYDTLSNYPHYYLITITGYGKEIEPYVPGVKEIIDTIKDLHNQGLTSNALVWRYDPIFFNDTYTVSWHYENFEMLASMLAKYSSTCIISFFDAYNRKLASWDPFVHLTKDELSEFSVRFLSLTKKYGFQLQTCCENLSFEEFKIPQGPCIDAKRILRVRQEQGFFENFGQNLSLNSHLYQNPTQYQLSHKLFIRDKNQRSSCLCCKSIDIGAYKTCGHGCVYCYAHGKLKPYEQKIDNAWFGY